MESKKKNKKKHSNIFLEYWVALKRAFGVVCGFLRVLSLQEFQR